MELTEEILLDNGFCKTEYGNIYNYISDDENSTIEVCLYNFIGSSVNIYCYETCDKLNKTIKTIEDLQKCLDFMNVPLKIKK